jgi:hypothetical protein
MLLRSEETTVGINVNQRDFLKISKLSDMYFAYQTTTPCARLHIVGACVSGANVVAQYYCVNGAEGCVTKTNYNNSQDQSTAHNGDKGFHLFSFQT